MMRKGLMGVAMSAALLGASIGTPALAESGVARNQVALGASGMVTPSMRVCARVTGTQVKARCVMGSDANALQDDSTTDSGPGAGTYVIGAGALAAVALGVVVATHHSHHAGDVSPPPPVSS